MVLTLAAKSVTVNPSVEGGQEPFDHSGESADDVGKAFLDSAAPRAQGALPVRTLAQALTGGCFPVPESTP